MIEHNLAHAFSIQDDYLVSILLKTKNPTQTSEHCMLLSSMYANAPRPKLPPFSLGLGQKADGVRLGTAGGTIGPLVIGRYLGSGSLAEVTVGPGPLAGPGLGPDGGEGVFTLMRVCWNAMKSRANSLLSSLSLSWNRGVSQVVRLSLLLLRNISSYDETQYSCERTALGS